MSLAPLKTPAPEKGAQDGPPVAEIMRAGYAKGARMPWRIKMALKIILAALPFSYRFLTRMGIFKHGDLAENLPNIQKSFDNHINFYRALYGCVPQTALELGPGDSLGHALSAKAASMQAMIFVDAADFASTDPDHYRSFYDYLLSHQPGCFDKAPPDFSRAGILAFTNSRYYTQGLGAMAHIEEGSIDFSFSHAVLEHIGRADFAPYMRELFRTHKPGSVSRHMVDLHDHLGGALNSMRFPAAFWERAAVRRAGFYTNRLTMNEMTAAAAVAGFDVRISRIIRWPVLPTPRTAMHKDFRDKSEEELNVCTFVMELYKPR